MVLVGPKIGRIKDVGALVDTQPGSDLLYLGLGRLPDCRRNSDINCFGSFRGDVQIFYEGLPGMFGYAYDAVRYSSQ